MDVSRRFEGVTPEVVERLKQGLQQKGIKPFEGDSGMIEAMGVKLAVNYHAAEQALDIQILEKPAFIPESLVWAQVEGPMKN
ncbi:MAG TPA: hypothetical protein VMT20_02780 [Terriglobia bacterium]|nr:hypothetical protein [Terriglobia bacterium]